MSIAVARPPQPEIAVRRAYRLVVGTLTTILIVVGLVGLPGATLATSRPAPAIPTSGVPETLARVVASSVPSEARFLAAPASEPSRELDPGRAAAIIGIAASALLAGLVVLLELRRERRDRAQPNSSGDGAEPAPARPLVDLDALVAGVRAEGRSTRRSPRGRGVPVWVRRLDPDALAPADGPESGLEALG